MSTTPWPADTAPANQHTLTDTELNSVEFAITDQEMNSIEFAGYVLHVYSMDRRRGSTAASELLAIVERCRPREAQTSGGVG